MKEFLRRLLGLSGKKEITPPRQGYQPRPVTPPVEPPRTVSGEPSAVQPPRASSVPVTPAKPVPATPPQEMAPQASGPSQQAPQGPGAEAGNGSRAKPAYLATILVNLTQDRTVSGTADFLRESGEAILASQPAHGTGLELDAEGPSPHMPAGEYELMVRLPPHPEAELRRLYGDHGALGFKAVAGEGLQVAQKTGKNLFLLHGGEDFDQPSRFGIRLTEEGMARLMSYLKENPLPPGKRLRLQVSISPEEAKQRPAEARPLDKLEAVNRALREKPVHLRSESYRSISSSSTAGSSSGSSSRNDPIYGMYPYYPYTYHYGYGWEYWHLYSVICNSGYYKDNEVPSSALENLLQDADQAAREGLAAAGFLTMEDGDVTQPDDTGGATKDARPGEESMQGGAPSPSPMEDAAKPAEDSGGQPPAPVTLSPPSSSSQEAVSSGGTSWEPSGSAYGR